MQENLNAMNVILINPPNIDKESYIARSADRWPHRVKRGKLFSNKIFPKYPLYLMYAAAVIEKAGFSVTVIDAAERDYDAQTTIDLVKSINPAPILTAVEISSPSMDQDVAFSQQLKENVSTHLSVLGAHATVYHEKIIRSFPFIDSVVRGEAFLSLAELAKSIREQSDLSIARGITYRKNSTININEDAPFIDDLDCLPYPARHLLDPSRYLMGHYTYEPQLLMITSMGCPYKCIFCLWSKVLHKSKVFLRSPQNVVKEMVFLKENYGAREIYFDDDCFNISISRVLDICREIIKNKITTPWITEMRCNNVTFEMLKTMKEAGCIKILYGVESGNQEILDNAKKNLNLEQIRNAFMLTKKAGIKSHATFMFGLPGETEETIHKTVEFAKELNPDTIQCSIALPYPGTEFYDLAKKDNTLKINTWKDFDGELCGAVEYPNLSKDIIRNSVGWMYKQYYMRPAYLINRIISIRSFADVKRFINLAMGYFRRFSN